MTVYINEFDENKNENKNKNKNTITMSLKVNDKQLLKNYNEIWKKIERLMSIEFDSKPAYGNDDKYIKTKIKIYKDSTNKKFCNKKASKKLPEEKVPCKCLSIIMRYSVLHAYEKHRPQTFLEERKYAQEKIKTKNYIDEESKSESYTDNDNDNDNKE